MAAVDPWVTKLLGQVQTDQGILAAAEQNGLFANSFNQHEHVDLLSRLANAAAFLNPQQPASPNKPVPPNTTAAAAELHEFEKTLYDAERKRGFWWRFNYMYALTPFLYLTAWFFLVFYRQSLIGFSHVTDTGVENAAVWGLLGGLGQGYYWLYQQVSDHEYRNQWLFWVLSLPITGAIFGGIAYLLVVGGLAPLVSSGGSAPNSYGALIFSAWAGFSWKDFVKLFGQALSGSKK